MKNKVKYILQRLLGFRTYLYVFAKFKIRTLRRDRKENDFFQFLNLLKNRNGVSLDIGANLGVMTVHLAKAFPETIIHAFEPMPDNAEILQRVVKHYGIKNVLLHEMALGEQSGTVSMILPTQEGTKMQGLSHVKHESITEWNEGEEWEVPMHTLDEILQETPVRGIKMDVENFEYFVLKGGKSLIERELPIIYTELWENENRHHCFEFLASLGYTPYVVVGNTLHSYDERKHLTQNFIFTAN